MDSHTLVPLKVDFRVVVPNLKSLKSQKKNEKHGKFEIRFSTPVGP